MEEKPKRWFRFRLRTLLIAFAVSAIPMAWVAYSLNWIRQRREAIDPRNVRDLRHTVWSTFEFDPPRAPGGLWVFGEKGRAALGIHWEGTDGELESLRILFPETNVFVIRRPASFQASRN